MMFDNLQSIQPGAVAFQQQYEQLRDNPFLCDFVLEGRGVIYCLVDPPFRGRDTNALTLITRMLPATLSQIEFRPILAAQRWRFDESHIRDYCRRYANNLGSSNLRYHLVDVASELHEFVNNMVRDLSRERPEENTPFALPDKGPIMIIGRPELFLPYVHEETHESEGGLFHRLLEAAGYPGRYAFVETDPFQDGFRVIRDHRTGLCYTSLRPPAPDSEAARDAPYDPMYRPGAPVFDSDSSRMAEYPILESDKRECEDFNKIIDYGVIFHSAADISVPRSVTIVVGCSSLGTWAATLALTDLVLRKLNVQDLEKATKPVEILVRTTVKHRSSHPLELSVSDLSIISTNFGFRRYGEDVEKLLRMFKGEVPPEFSACLTFQGDLDKDIISKELQKQFEDNGISLSGNAEISIEEKDSKWLIADKDNRYIVERKGNQLNIYQSDKRNFEVLYEVKPVPEAVSLVPKDKPLFSIGLTFQGDLDKDIISKELQKQFEDNGISLSGNAEISIEEKDSKWLIADKDNRYIVERKGNQLNIYQSDKQYTVQVRDCEHPLDEYVSVDDHHVVMVGGSEMQKIVNQIKDLAEYIAEDKEGKPVLIIGAPGTGKELAARLIYYYRCQKLMKNGMLKENERNEKASYVPINCGAIPSGMAEAELFGVAKDGVQDLAERLGILRKAGDGVACLDEISALEYALQPKLLRVLQERTVKPIGDDLEKPCKAQVVALTNRDLLSEKFRPDLYSRFFHRLKLPPLCNRRLDIPALMLFFLHEWNPAIRTVAVGEYALRVMLAENYHEGNVRTLQRHLYSLLRAHNNCLERITLSDLPLELRERVGMPADLEENTWFKFCLGTPSTVEVMQKLKSQINNPEQTLTAKNILGIIERAMLRLPSEQTEPRLVLRELLSNKQEKEAIRSIGPLAQLGKQKKLMADEELCELVSSLLRWKFSNKEDKDTSHDNIASLFGVNRSTIGHWIEEWGLNK